MKIKNKESQRERERNMIYSFAQCIIEAMQTRIGTTTTTTAEATSASSLE